MAAPDFPDLDQSRIAALSDTDLAETMRLSLDALLCCESTDGALELMEADEVAALAEALWTCHLAPGIRRMPEVNPYAGEEISSLQEALAGVTRESLRRFGSQGLVSRLHPIGEAAALDLITLVEDWQTRYQNEGPDLD